MARRNYCTRYAQISINGQNKDSRLHKDLLDKIGVRAVANLVYAMYLQPGVANDMTSRDYRVNTLGQHRMSDVLEYFGFQNIVTDIMEGTIQDVEVSMGVRDPNTGQLKNFTDNLQALNIAKRINELRDANGNSRHLAATVVRHGTSFQVLVNPISSNTFERARQIDDQLFIWEQLKQTMQPQGINMDTLRQLFGDIITLESGMINYLENMMMTDNRNLTKREMEFLLASNLSADAQTLRSVFGNNVIQAMYDNYHVSGNPGYAGLIERVLNQSKAIYSVLDSNFNARTIDRVASEYAVSDDKRIRDILMDLNNRYGIDFREIVLQDKHVKSLSEATAKAVAVLEARIRELENKTGTREERKKLSRLRDTLLKELQSKRYYLGLVNYINEALEQILGLETQLNDALSNIPLNGVATFEHSMALARVLRALNIYTNGYINLFRDLLDDLSHVERLAIDENIALIDIDNIKSMATTVFNTLDGIKRRGEEQSRTCMINIMTHLFGDKVGPEVIINSVATCASSTWGMDILYSFGKLSDPVCAAIGDMVRTALDDRNEALRKYTVRIREANAKLYDSGSNSEYMYENDGHILSDYDWVKYYQEYKREKGRLTLQGITEFELEEAMELWELQHTDELEVDHVSGRTERVPKLSLYKKLYDGYNSFRDRLTDALLEYYDTMMQIKGEIGTLLPDWALSQFVPPQLRRDLITAVRLEAGWSPLEMSNMLSTIGEKVQEMWEVKEDDTDWAINGSRPTYSLCTADLSGKESKNIPIFFVNTLSDLDELLKNFSAGLQALAATAQNYHSMSDIVDIAEFMRDYIRNHLSGATNGVPDMSVSGNKSVGILSEVTLRSLNSAMMLVLDNMFDKHFYNENIKDNPYFAKFVKGLVHYTSFKGLVSNYIGATANLLVGEHQLFQMSLANTLHKLFTKNKTPYFGITDWALGCAKLFGAPFKFIASVMTGKKVPSVIFDLATNNKQSMDYLIAEYFDLFNENYGTMMHTNYYKGARQLMHNMSFLLYGAGEKAIRYNALWAMLNNRKVLINNRTVSLKDAFNKSGYKNAPTLTLLPNVYSDNIQLTDDNGNLTDAGKEYMRTFKKELRYCCQGMFGAMNEEDKGTILQYSLGMAAMNFRLWMVGHYSERLRGIHWDYDKKEFVRGYYTSTGRYIRRALVNEEMRDLWEDGLKFKFFLKLGKNLIRFKGNWRLEWTRSTQTEKLDLMRVMSAVISYGLLFGLTCFVGGGLLPKFGGIIPVGDPEKERKRRKAMTPEEKFIYYQLRRLVFEADSSTPLGAFLNFETIMKSPIPALRTFDNAFYFITGLGDMGTPLENGPDRGMDKYWRNVMKYNLPFYRDIRRFLEWEDDETAFMMFNDTNILKF